MTENNKKDSEKVPNFKLKRIVAILSVIIIVGIIAVYWIEGFSYLMSDSDSNKDKNDNIRITQMVQLRNAIDEYKKNNLGRMPADDTILIQRYLNNDFSDPDGMPYAITFVTLSNGDIEKLPNPNNMMYILNNAVCDSDRRARYSSSEQDYAIMYHHYGSYTMCIDNQ